MTEYHAPQDDFRFLFEHYLPLDDYKQVAGFEDIKEIALPIIEEGAKLCEQV
jgi:hypothetical protein